MVVKLTTECKYVPITMRFADVSCFLAEERQICPPSITWIEAAFRRCPEQSAQDVNLNSVRFRMVIATPTQGNNSNARQHQHSMWEMPNVTAIVSTARPLSDVSRRVWRNELLCWQNDYQNTPFANSLLGWTLKFSKCSIYSPNLHKIVVSRKSPQPKSMYFCRNTKQS